MSILVQETPANYPDLHPGEHDNVYIYGLKKFQRILAAKFAVFGLKYKTYKIIAAVGEKKMVDLMKKYGEQVDLAENDVIKEVRSLYQFNPEKYDSFIKEYEEKQKKEEEIKQEQAEKIAKQNKEYKEKMNYEMDQKIKKIRDDVLKTLQSMSKEEIIKKFMSVLKENHIVIEF